MHFYATNKETGKVEPKHFVENKSKGGLRPSRVTDAKKALKGGERWYPSVTSVMNILDKPALNNWKVDQALLSVHTLINSNTELRSDDFEGFKRHIRAVTEERANEAPKAGTAIHDVLEKFWSDGTLPKDEIEQKICCNVRAVLLEHTGLAPEKWNCEDYFIEKTFGYAGQADLVNSGWVIDYKSKQEAAKFKVGKMAFSDHSRQLGAYGAALCQPDFRAANIFICLENGEVDFHEHDAKSLHNGYFDFLDCLEIYKRNTYNCEAL